MSATHDWTILLMVAVYYGATTISTIIRRRKV